MSYLCKVLAHNVRHPFSFNTLTNLLNKEAFKNIEGEGSYAEFTWNSDGDNFEPDIDCGPADKINRNDELDELYEDDVSIILIKWGYCKGYIYPKEDFVLVEDPTFAQKILKERYPKIIVSMLLNPKHS